MKGQKDITDNRRNSITQIMCKIYLNGRLYGVNVGNGDKPMTDREIVEGSLFLALNNFFLSTDDSKERYILARDFFQRLIDDE